jgi:hypothetical protein
MTFFRIFSGAIPALTTTLLLLISPALAAAASAEDFPSVTLWPLVYHQQDQERARTDILYPVFHYQREGSRQRFAIRPFIFNKERDPARRYEKLNVLWPLTQFKSEGENSEDYVFPFYYRMQKSDRSSFHLWPFYGHSVQEDGSETWSTIYPFFQYQLNENQGSRRIDYFWPLGRVETTADSSSNYLLPLWWSRKTPEVTGRFIFPYFRYESETSRHDGIFPLWYRLRAQNEEIDLLLPFWYAQRGENLRVRTLFPFYWDYDRGEERQLRLLIPVYGRYLNQDDDYKLLFPVYFRHSNQALQSELHYYFPFYGDYRKGQFIQHRYYLFPLYAHIQDEAADREAWYFLWPLVYRDRRPDASQTWALPLFWMKKNQQREIRVALLPPYFYLDQQDGRKEVHYWPFYGFSQDQTYTERSLIWPLLRWGSSPSGDQRGWQFLLLYRKIEAQRQLFGFFPLWHYDRKAERVRNVSLLHWHEKSENSEQFSLFHLANPDWSLFSLRARSSEQHQHLFPFYSFTKNAEMNHRSLSVLWPIYRYKKEKVASVSHQFLWKLLYTEKSAEGHEKGFLWRLLRSKEDKAGSLFEFNPFYYGEKRADGETYASWLGGIYAVRGEVGAKKHRLFWLINW